MPNLPPEPRHARLGLWLFSLYVVAYAGFVGLNAFAPAAMEQPAVGGVNLAVASGVGLITGAFALALAYAWLCRAPAGGRP
jgi:uncharacterized membrane protein (DUF485 family)